MSSKNPLTARTGPSRGTVIGIVAVVLFAALVGVGVYWAQRPADVVTPANSTATGTTVGNPSASKTIDVYQDFQCPVCKQFEQQSGSTIDQAVASGQAKVIYHPVAILDRYSPDRYSSRSSAASGCAADAGVFAQYLKLLYENQPEENQPGLPDAKLIALGEQAGGGPGFAQCVQSGKYAPWTAELTDQASKDGIQGTPTVKVDGNEIQDPTPDALKAALAS
jgi:protein-disulfide isomerase